jgi:uncharacterized membrane protein YozB (DUF420 family)
MSVTDLPAVNATLNSICTLFLLAGWWFIKHERKQQHIICMVSALTVSAVFLACYVVYHYHVGSIRFTYEHPVIRPLYFFILITHIFLAAAIVPLILMTVIPALSGSTSPSPASSSTSCSTSGSPRPCSPRSERFF